MHRRWPRLVIIYLILLAAGWMLGKSLLDLASVDTSPQSAEHVRTVIFMATGAFIVASAIPFVPGLEIGLGLMILFGAKMAVLVYASLVVALVISYVVGRFVPAPRVAAAFDFVGLGKARDLVLRLAPLDSAGRLDALTAQMPHRLAPLILRYRYLALVVLFNLPGNSVIGGGGGIAFTAGLSGLFSFPAFIFSLALAAIPVPLFFVVFGRFA